jgi:MurNAc alpha-1-phosphate uridylyltransferase
MTIRPLMIFAAGFGTRMGALTADRPKPLIAVAGRPLIDRALALGRAAGAGPIVVNLHYRAAQLRQHLAGQTDLAFSEEAPDILETGGGLRQALPLLGEGPVLTLNPDAVWTGPNPLAALASAWDGARMGALLMLVPADRATGHRGPGDFTLAPDGRIARTGPCVYGGAQMIHPSCLAPIPERAFSLNRAWDLLAAEGRLFGLIHPGGWCDVGHPGAIPLAEALLQGVLHA